MNMFVRLIPAALAAGTLLAAPQAGAQDVIFLSTQLRPIEEAQKVREVILKGKMDNGRFLAEKDSLITKCPSKFTTTTPGQSS